MKKIKIARVVTVPFAFTHILDLLETLSNDSRFDLHIICSDGPYLYELKKKLPKATFHIVQISRDIDLKSDIKSLWKLVWLYRNEQFMIVHSHSPKAGLLSALAGFFAGIKIRLHTFTGQVWMNLKGPKKLLLKSLDLLIATLNTHNFSDSFGQMKFLIRNHVVSSKKISVIHKGSFGGINVDRFSKQSLKEKIKELRNQMFSNFEGKILLYLGRINEDKGIVDLVNAFYILKKSYAVKLLLVGPLESLNNAAFVKLIESLKKDEDVAMIDFTNEPELYMGISDVFCFPSYREGFGTVALEASAMEMPVVGSNIYGLSEAIEDGKSGYLFKVKNVEDLASKLDLLLSDEIKAKELGLYGRKRIFRDFKDKVLTEKLIEEYLRLLKKYE